MKRLLMMTFVAYSLLAQCSYDQNWETKAGLSLCVERTVWFVSTKDEGPRTVLFVYIRTDREDVESFKVDVSFRTPSGETKTTTATAQHMPRFDHSSDARTLVNFYLPPNTVPQSMAVTQNVRAVEFSLEHR